MILVISLCFLTGCWDRTELNDLAIELGWGLDQAKNNKIEISAQFIIPSKWEWDRAEEVMQEKRFLQNREREGIHMKLYK